MKFSTVKGIYTSGGESGLPPMCIYTYSDPPNFCKIFK